MNSLVKPITILTFLFLHNIRYIIIDYPNRMANKLRILAILICLVPTTINNDCCLWDAYTKDRKCPK